METGQTQFILTEVVQLGVWSNTVEAVPQLGECSNTVGDHTAAVCVVKHLVQ